MAEEKLGVSDDFDDSATEEEEEQPDWLDDLCNMDNEKDGMGPSTSTNHPSASGVHLVNFHASRGISSAQFAGDPGAKKLNIMEMGKLMYEHAVQSGGNVQPPSTAPSKKPTKSKSTYDYESYEYFLPPPPKRSSPAEWEQTKPSAMCLGRIVGDLKEFSVTPIPGITVYSYESNITKMLALISGPAGTPYEGGFFQFYLHCPPDYPINSPHARFLTTDGQTVRFNPNLYANGYICLSLLGNWEENFCSSCDTRSMAAVRYPKLVDVKNASAVVTQLQQSWIRGASRMFLESYEIGWFSLTGPAPNSENNGRIYHDNRSELRKYRYRGKYYVDIDLSQGRSSFIFYQSPRDPGQEEHLNNFLQWILHHRQQFDRFRPKLVCRRSCLSKILLSKDFGSKWTMVVAMIGGVLYMTSFRTEEEQEREHLRSVAIRNGKDPIGDGTYFGYNFEKTVTTDPWDVEELEKPVNVFNGFMSVRYANADFGGIIYCGEVDCCEPDDPASYIELKTSDSHSWKFPKKQRNWWAQSFPAGTSKIIVGLKRNGGYVKNIREIKTAEILPDFDKDLCTGFLQSFISHVYETVVLSYDEAIYKFEWNQKADRVITIKILASESNYRFIPDWYVSGKPPISEFWSTPV